MPTVKSALLVLLALGLLLSAAFGWCTYNNYSSIERVKSLAGEHPGCDEAEFLNLIDTDSLRMEASLFRDEGFADNTYEIHGACSYGLNYSTVIAFYNGKLVFSGTQQECQARQTSARMAALQAEAKALLAKQK